MQECHPQRLALLLNLVNLRLQRWYPQTRLADVGLGLLGMGVLKTILLMGPNFILDPEWSAQQRAAGVSLDEIEGAMLPIVNVSLLITIGIALISLAGASLRKVIYLARSWRLQGRDIDILFHLSLILAGIYIISAPLAATRTNATLLDISVPLGLIARLIIVKSMIPRRV